MTNIKAIDHILIAVPENREDEIRKFYGEIIGLEEIEKPEPLNRRGGAWFKIGQQQLHIGIDKNFVPAKKAHPAFEVTNLEELKIRFKEKGIEVIDDENLKGAERFFCHDSFGNRLEFLNWL